MHRVDKNGKRVEGRDREYLDLTPVNPVLEPFKHPIPKIKDLVHKLSDHKLYSELDLADSYEQLMINDELSQIFTFTISFGKISMTVMPYGMICASDCFQHAITQEFWEFLDIFLSIYIDNMLVYTNSYEEQLEALEKILVKCRSVGLSPRREKCYFMQTAIRTMGFVVSHKTVKSDTVKIAVS